MSILDRVALVLNASAVLAWLPAFARTEDELLFLALAVTMAAILVSSVAIASRNRQTVAPSARSPLAPVDELDPHRVLDLDARLEALERAQHDAVDAARWRSLVESGQVTAPAAPAAETHAETRRQLVAG